MSAHKRKVPTWIVAILGLIITILAVGTLLWISTLHDSTGAEILDTPASSVIVAFLGIVGTLLAVILQRATSAEEQLKANSGSSARDAIDRTEELSRKAIEMAEHAARAARKASSDTEQLREDVQSIRTDMTGSASDIRGIRKDIGRITDALSSFNK